MGSAFTGVQDDWGNMLVSFVIRTAWKKQVKGLSRWTMILNLHFIIDAVCARLSLHLYLLARYCICEWKSICVTVFHSVTHHFNIQLHTHTHIYAHTNCDLNVEDMSVHSTAMARQQLRLACVWAGSLEAGKGDSVSLALLMNVSLPPAHSLHSPLAGT